MITGDERSINQGAVYESVVAQELYAHGFTIPAMINEPRKFLYYFRGSFHIFFITFYHLEQDGTHKKGKNALFLQKNQLTMNDFTEKLLSLQCCYKNAADILRKQPSFVPSENLDNSQFVGMNTEVVRPIMYRSNHPPLWGWVSTYIYWCELISFFYKRVVQNLQIKNERGSHLFVSKRVITL